MQNLPKSINERIAKSPRRLLVQRSPQGQRLRQGILRGATIAFITTGYEGCRGERKFTFSRSSFKEVLDESRMTWMIGVKNDWSVLQGNASSMRRHTSWAFALSSSTARPPGVKLWWKRKRPSSSFQQLARNQTDGQVGGHG